MSQRRHIPIKLLCLATIGLLTLVAIHKRPPLRQAVSTSPQIAAPDTAALRYPNGLAREGSKVVLTGFAFDAPPLPNDAGDPQAKSPIPSSISQQSPSVRRTFQGTGNRRQRSPLSAIQSPPPVRNHVPKPQPRVAKRESGAQSDFPVARAPSVTRLPPVEEVEDTTTFKRTAVVNQIPTDPMPFSKKVALSPTRVTKHQSSRHVASRPARTVVIPERKPRENASRISVDKFKTTHVSADNDIPIDDRDSVVVGTGLAVSPTVKPNTSVHAKPRNENPAKAVNKPPVKPSNSAIAEPVKNVRTLVASSGFASPRPPARQPARPSARPPTRPAVAKRIPGPNPALVAVSRQAMDLVLRGQSLAVRNAQYSARADFVASLRLIAQANDVLEGGSQHSKDLAAGLLALREAQDFIPSGNGRWTDQFDVHVIAAAHGTPIIRATLEGGANHVDLTPWLARQRYYTFAQHMLAQAGADDAVASAALCSLGKLYVGRDGTTGEENLVSSAQAMAFFQSSLEVDSRNYMAANELGVLLARYGQLQDSRRVLQHGVAIKNNYPPLWNNLSVVHQRLGEVDLQRRARHEFKLAQHRVESGQTQADAGNSIRWVDTEEFARLTPSPQQPRSATRTNAPANEPETQKPSWRFFK
jgi:hypothetical protein